MTPRLAVRDDAGAVVVTAAGYQLQVRASPPRAVLADPGGRIWSQLSLLASLDRTDGADESFDVPAPEVSQHPDGDVDVVLRARSTAWASRTVTLRCRPEQVEVVAEVRGTGVLTDVSLLGGRAVLATGACGTFRSSTEFQSVFSPAPTEPVQVVRPAASAVALGVVGDAGAGRLNGIFSPPPLCLALGHAPPAGATDVPDGDWLGLWLRAGAPDMPFTQLRYVPVDGGFLLELDYDGHTRVDGAFRTPTVVLRPVADPWDALRRHRDDLVGHGLAAQGPSHEAAAWWREPVVCPWGAQCARAPVLGRRSNHAYRLDELPPAVLPPGTARPADMAAEVVYDEVLDHLAAHGVLPGTVVVDDGWQAAYGAATPSLDRWPDLRGWIAARHEAGQRVLLWWKAWDAGGVPATECVLDAGGRPVAVDPGNQAYLDRLAATVAEMLSPDGLGADGLKVDFTQRAPAGPSLRAASDLPGTAPVWGISALYALLSTLYSAAKAAKPDALVVTHTPHPAFADVCDMVRLNDVLERDPWTAPVPVVEQMRVRSAVVRAVLPRHLVDTDQWPMPDRAAWRSYVPVQPSLGVPALYYAESIDRSGEPLTSQDLALVADVWQRYRDGLGATR